MADQDIIIQIQASANNAIAAMNKLTATIGNTSNKLGVAATKTKSFGLGIAKLSAAFYTLKRVSSFVMKSIKSSMDFSEDVNLFQTVFRNIGLKSGEAFEFAYLEKAEQFNKWFSEALSLDPRELMRYQGLFAQMSSSMGLTADSAYEVSASLTMLGNDIASLFNIGIEDAMLKLRSGLSGQIRPMRSLGVDISKTTIAEIALGYGIEQSVEKMNAATKVQLRYLAIMQQLRVAMTDFSRTIDSPANQLRILGQQWDLLSRSMGNTFLPIVTRIMPYLNGIVIALRMIITEVAALMGYELPDFTDTDIYGAYSDDAIDGIEDTTDAINDATAAAKAYKKTLLGIDELNLMANNDSSSGSGASGGVSGAGYAVLDAAIAEEYQAYMKAMQEQVSKMQNKAQEWALKYKDTIKSILKAVLAIGAGMIAWKTSTKFMTGLNTIAKFFGKGGFIAMITPALTKLTSGFGSVASSLGMSTGMFAAVVAVVIAGIITAVARFRELWKTNEDFRKGLEIIGGVFKDIYIVVRIALWWIKEKIVEIADKLVDLMPPALQDFIRKVGDLLNNVWKYIKKNETWLSLLLYLLMPVVEWLYKIIIAIGKISNHSDALKKKISDVWANIKTSITTVLFSVTVAISNFISGIVSKFSGLPDALYQKLFLFKAKLYQWATNARAWVSEYVPNVLNAFVDWFNLLPEKFVEIGRNLLRNIWNGMLSVGQWLKNKIAGLFGNVGQIIIERLGNVGVGTFEPIIRATNFAGGGVPNTGEMFIAREAGAELVGSIGGRTAVMNNDQIVASVSSGVYNAVKSALGGGMGGDWTIQVYDRNGTLTGEQIVTAAERYNRRLGVTRIAVG